MAQQHRENMWREQFMAELKNEEVNRQLCQLMANEIFGSGSPETQEQILAEWNDWRQDENHGHSCGHCEKVFTRSHDLKRHVRRVHTGERPYACGLCGKDFTSSNMLKRHEKIHSEKAYECSRCHKKFDRKDNFTRHMKMHERRGAEQKNPDTTFIYSLMELHQNTENHDLQCVLNYLSHWRQELNEEALESAAETFFSCPLSYKYSVKATVEWFRSRETGHKKAYQEYLEKKLAEHFNHQA